MFLQVFVLVATSAFAVRSSRDSGMPGKEVPSWPKPCQSLSSTTKKIALRSLEKPFRAMISTASSGEMRLKSRFTFIDVVEEHMTAARRSASLPGRLFPQHSPANAEDEYLSTLLQDATPLSLPAPALPDSAPKEAELDMPGTKNDADMAGSFGHPHFCRRPCLLLAHGNCQHGMACKYCHHEHEGQRPDLSKRTREKLKQMSSSGKLLLLHASLQQKAQQVPELLGQVTVLLDIMKAELRDQVETSHLAAPTGNGLQNKISEMSVAAMLGDVMTAHFEPGLRARLQQELRRLRYA